MIRPPRWTSEELETERRQAIEDFRRQRLREPLQIYLDAFDQSQKVVGSLLEATADLTQLGDQAADVLTDPDYLEAFRYLAGPPVSADDLKTLAETSLSPARLIADPESARRVAETILTGLDIRRFPWLDEDRKPTEAERAAAILASTALLATSRSQTARRHQGKSEQEDLVERVLLESGCRRVQARTVETLVQAPDPGEFCRESLLGDRKADFLVGLGDTRLLAIECKVSNSAVNSVKRLNNDAAAKAVAWRKDFGDRQIVPAAVLSGVYKLHNLEDAQHRGLTLFWAHDLGAMLTWIERAVES